MNLKLSRHTLFLDDLPDPGKHLVYQMRTQAQVVIDRALKQRLQRLGEAAGDPGEPAGEAEARAFAALQRMGILLPREADEGRILEEWFHALKNDTTRLGFTVLTTYDCNFACPYCIEEGARNRTRLEPETARRVVAYIGRRLERDAPRELSLKFYGGEPLMNLKALRFVAREAGDLARARGISFSFHLYTNGSLLTPRVVEDLQRLGLKGVRITLDGPREHHDRTRPFRNGRGSFDRVLRNLQEAAGRIEVALGGNFSPQSAPAFPRLLDELQALGLASKLKLVDFKPILATVQDRSRSTQAADLGCAFQEPEVQRGMVELRRAVLERGFRATPGLGVQLCAMVMSRADRVIDPRGEIYRCPAFVGRAGFSAGHIDRPEEEDFSTLDLWRRCGDCPWVPLCGDGCPFAAYVRYGDLYRLNCQRGFMETMVRENLKLNYLFRKKADPS